jgi:anti-sigma B factor antagonist
MRTETRVVNDGVLRLAVTGEIDLDTADALYDAVLAEIDRWHPAEMVVDLAQVTLCDSTGIDALLRARDAAYARAVDLVVINPRGVVRQALAVTGTLDRLAGLPAPR